MVVGDIIHVEVAYAEPDHQSIISLDVPAGTTLIEAVRQSGILEEYSGIDIDSCRVGVFGKLGKPDQELRAGDRVEIYRLLTADPKKVRRQRASEGKSIGKLKSGDAS